MSVCARTRQGGGEGGVREREKGGAGAGGIEQEGSSPWGEDPHTADGPACVSESVCAPCECVLGAQVGRGERGSRAGERGRSGAGGVEREGCGVGCHPLVADCLCLFV